MSRVLEKVIKEAAADKRTVAQKKAKAAPKLAKQRKAAKPKKFAFGSGFAFLDVTIGRQELRKIVRDGRVVPVIIRGVIDCEFSEDDGESQEFEVQVEALEIGEPRKRGKGSYE